MFYKGTLLILVSIVQIALSLEILSVAIIAVSLTPFTLSYAEENVDIDSASVNAAETATQECIESGTCNNPDSDSDVDSTENTEDAAAASDSSSDATDSIPEPTFEVKTAANGDRIISAEELALHTTVDKRIWLSILGKVYDVTDGVDFYDATKGGYKFYAGRDASPCFSSGNNTPEGAEEKLEEWEEKKVMPVWEWSEFYADHETYKFLGVLGGSRYYDEEGNELQLRKDIVHKSSEAKRIADAERDAKREARKKEREEKKKKKEAEMARKRAEAAAAAANKK